MNKHYVDSGGIYLLSTDGVPPVGGIVVDPAPEYADQVWLFPGWGPSFLAASAREDQWRDEQMSRIATQLLMLEDEDPAAEPGTVRQWRDYRIALRQWVEGAPNYPDATERPMAPH